MRLAYTEEPEKKPDAGGLESADVWGDAADDVSLYNLSES